MAGTLFGLSLSQRVDLNGTPSVAWILYVYQANTSTPVQTYQDTALTVLNQWPLTADAYGMMRQFWVPDGSYRARATNSSGSLTYFDQSSILALGSSSGGGGGGGGGVDPTTIFQTGDVMWLDRTGARTGWVRDNGRTIGSITSGASERAAADCQPLFEFLWNNFSDTFCPVVTGRGASSLADWGANKRITLPDKRGCAIMGADVMGNVSSSRYVSVPVVTGAIDTPGSMIGESLHNLNTTEIPAHSHTGSTGGQSADHTHTVPFVTTGHVFTGGAVSAPDTTGTTVSSGTSVDHTHSFTSNNTGGGSSHNNTPFAIIGTYYRKL